MRPLTDGILQSHVRPTKRNLILRTDTTERTEVKEGMGASGCGKSMLHDPEVHDFVCSH